MFKAAEIKCWIPKATMTHSEYVIIVAFPVQKWLHQRALILLYTYIACLVFISMNKFPSVRFFSVASRNGAALIIYNVNIRAYNVYWTVHHCNS